jgi:hypothetical protein
MSVVAAGAQRSVGQQFAQSGTASSMWTGPVGGAAQSSMPFEAPGGVSVSTSSSRKRPPPERFSAEEFDTLVSLVENSKKSAKKALEIMQRTEVPESTARRWLIEAGVEPGSRSGRRPALSVAQIEAAMAAHESYRRTHGADSHGILRATHNAVSGGAFTYDSLRTYFNKDGLTAYGETMLERARKYEAEARENVSGSP